MFGPSFQHNLLKITFEIPPQRGLGGAPRAPRVFRKSLFQDFAGNLDQKLKNDSKNVPSRASPGGGLSGWTVGLDAPGTSTSNVVCQRERERDRDRKGKSERERERDIDRGTHKERQRERERE